MGSLCSKSNSNNATSPDNTRQSTKPSDNSTATASSSPSGSSGKTAETALLSQQKMADTSTVPAASEEKSVEEATDPFAGYTETEDVKKALDIVNHGVVKVDHFENIYRLDPRFEGAPNLRQARGYFIFGSGQPTLPAIRKLFDTMYTKLDIQGVVWFNMRSEPVIYVNGISYAPRDPGHLSENIRFEGDLSTDDVSYIENRLTRVVASHIDQSADGSTFVYHKDTYALLPQDRKDMELTDTVTDVSKNVRSLLQTFSDLSDKKDSSEVLPDSFTVEMHRLPVNDERAPDAKDLDRLVTLVTQVVSRKNIALVFNCQMGKGRTTMGMICAALLRKHLDQFDDSLYDRQTSSSSDTGIYEWPFPIDTPTVSSEEARDDAQQKKDTEDPTGTSDAVMVVTDAEQEVVGDGSAGVGLSKEEMKGGKFTIILKLCEVLSKECGLDGNQIKEETDDIIDRCQHLQSMRVCIYMTYIWYQRETKERRDYWKHISVSFLERYFVLICFAAYLQKCVEKDPMINIKQSYSDWYDAQSAIIDLAQSIADFNWD